MIAVLGYNFCSDRNAIDPMPTNVSHITKTRIENGIYDHFNVSNNVTKPYDPTIPTDWDWETVMDCNFENNISAGNVDQIAKDITGYRLKRRKVGEFEWTTIKEAQINSLSELAFTFTDNLALNFTEYQYAYVPMMSGVEGDYIVEQIATNFKGVFICDLDTVYKLYSGVVYGNNDQVRQVGVFTPYGRQYPVVISNGLQNYQTGSIQGKVLPADFEQTGNIDRQEITARKNTLLKFLTNGKPKVIKDWNGEAWCLIITGNPSVSYDSNYGMGMCDVNASWTETGKPDNKSDLFMNGLIPTEA